MTFLQTAKDTNGAQLQIDCYSPQSADKEHEHIHPFQENKFSILSGKLVFCINGQEHTATAGDVVSVPKNVPHLFRNPDAAEAHYMQEFFPALDIETLFRTFFALSRDSKLNKKGTPGILRTAVIMLQHRKELRLTKPAWWLQRLVFSLLAPLGLLAGYKHYYR